MEDCIRSSFHNKASRRNQSEGNRRRRRCFDDGEALVRCVGGSSKNTQNCGQRYSVANVVEDFVDHDDVLMRLPITITKVLREIAGTGRWTDEGGGS